jgi:hypothetical protein
MAFQTVYGVTVENTPEEQHRALGYTAGSLIPHIWPLFADVSNVLGDELPREWPLS